MKRTEKTPAAILTLPLALLCLALISPTQAGPNPSEGMLPGGRVNSGATGKQLLGPGYAHTCAIKPDGSLTC